MKCVIAALLPTGWRLLFMVLLLACCLSPSDGRAADIVVGQINAQTGGGASLGLPLSQGAQAYIDSVNAKGGIHGRKLRLVTLDDEFNEAKTVAVATRLISEQRPVALINTVGAPNIDQLITTGLLDRTGVPVVGPLTNSTTARERRNPHVFFVRAGLREEVAAMVRQADVMGFKRVAVFFQNDTSGRDGLKLVETELALRGLKPVAVASYERADFKADEAVKVFQQAQPQVILTISVAAATSNLVRLVGRSISSGAMIIGNSGNNPDAIVKSLGAELTRGLGLVQVTPSMGNQATPMIKEYFDVMRSHGPKDWQPSAFSLEGYMVAKILCEALRRIPGEPTRELLLQSLETMSPFDLGGYAVSFGRDNRLGSRYAEVAIVTQSGRLVR